MPVLVTLGGYPPPARSAPDNVRWTHATIEESTSPTGPWTVIEGPIALNPPVEDPAAPPTYTFTTDNAAIGTGGYYRIVWRDEVGFTQATPPALYVPFRPSLADVSALLHARTRSDEAGSETGTFDDTTVPTGEQVERFIDGAVDELLLKVGDDIPDRAVGHLRRLATIRAAMDVEMSLDPDRVSDDTSAYARLSDRYDAGIEALTGALASGPTAEILDVGDVRTGGTWEERPRPWWEQPVG